MFAAVPDSRDILVQSRFEVARIHARDDLPGLHLVPSSTAAGASNERSWEQEGSPIDEYWQFRVSKDLQGLASQDHGC